MALIVMGTGFWSVFEVSDLVLDLYLFLFRKMTPSTSY